MKTTLNLDDELLRSAKRMAVDRGVTLTQVVEEALAAAVLRPPETASFKLHWQPVKGQRRTSVDVADRVALHDFMEDRG